MNVTEGSFRLVIALGPGSHRKKRIDYSRISTAVQVLLALAIAACKADEPQPDMPIFHDPIRGVSETADVLGCDPAPLRGDTRCSVDLDDNGFCRWSVLVSSYPPNTYGGGRHGSRSILMEYYKCLPNLRFTRVRRVIEALDLPRYEKDEILQFLFADMKLPEHEDSGSNYVSELSVSYDESLAIRGLLGTGWRTTNGGWQMTGIEIYAKKKFTPVTREGDATDEWLETFTVRLGEPETSPVHDWTKLKGSLSSLPFSLGRQKLSREREDL